MTPWKRYERITNPNDAPEVVQHAVGDAAWHWLWPGPTLRPISEDWLPAH